MVLQKKYSANDLTIDIHELYKKYNMIGYYKECCSIMMEHADEDLKKQLESAFEHSNNTPLLHQSILEFIDRSNMTPEKADEFIDKTIGIQEKYNFEQYSKECSNLRIKFLNERKDYLRNNIKFMTLNKKNKHVDLPSNVNNFHDMVLAKWLDDIIEQTKPSSMELTYEDLNGKISTITIAYKEDSLNEDTIDTRPIDRFSGMGIFDSFVLHAFYDIVHREWKYVPVSLISEVHGKYVDELFNSANPDEEDEE